MLDGRRADLTARVFLTLGVLAPYWHFLTLRAIFVTDSHFTSDLFNGELPGRLIFSQLLRSGQLPLWTGDMLRLSLVGAAADQRRTVRAAAAGARSIRC